MRCHRRYQMRFHCPNSIRRPGTFGRRACWSRSSTRSASSAVLLKPCCRACRSEMSAEGGRDHPARCSRNPAPAELGWIELNLLSTARSFQRHNQRRFPALAPSKSRHCIPRHAHASGCAGPSSSLEPTSAVVQYPSGLVAEKRWPTAIFVLEIPTKRFQGSFNA